MKYAVAVTCLLLLTGLAISCSGHRNYHPHALGDPMKYQAHFPDMDANGDGRMDAEEFNAHFQQADPHVFTALDINKDGAIDHEEWHRFKEAHGMRDH